MSRPHVLVEQVNRRPKKHAPANQAAGYTQTRIQRSRYLQEVKNLDSHLGELLDLATRYLSEDRIILFSSDHGAHRLAVDSTTRHAHAPGRQMERASNPGLAAMVSWIDVLTTLIDIVEVSLKTSMAVLCRCPPRKPNLTPRTYIHDSAVIENECLSYPFSSN